jgi:hypothetical protein
MARVARLSPPGHQIPQFIVAEFQQLVQCIQPGTVELPAEAGEELLQDDVVFQAPAPAPPAQAAKVGLEDRVHRSSGSLNRPFQQQVFDFSDRLGGVQAFRADVHAIHDGVAPEQTVGVLEIIEAGAGSLVPAVGDKAIGLE